MSEFETTAEIIESEPAESAELIKVVQLPIIYEQLETVKTAIQNSVAHALSLECTEESYKEIKDIKAKMNADFKRLESLRIAVKKEVMKPYDEFETHYKACVTDIYKPAEAELTDRINAVTDGLKAQKKEKAVIYFDEYVKAKEIDFLTFEMLNITINMNTTDKSIKKAITEFVDRVAEALEMINTQEYAAEILVEYKKTLNASQAILTINNRHKAIAEEIERQEKLKAIEEARKAQTAKVEQAIIDDFEESAGDSFFSAPEVVEAPEETEEFHAPVVAEETEQVHKASFTVMGTKAQLRKLVDFLKEAKMNYEQF